MAGSDDDHKVVVHVRALDDAPMLKRHKFKISGREKFLKIIEFLRRQLHKDTLFVYVNSASNPFAPKPDELVINVYNNFANDEIILWYLMLYGQHGDKKLDLRE